MDSTKKEGCPGIDSEERGKAQPKAAFLENAKYTIKHIVEVFKK